MNEDISRIVKRLVALGYVTKDEMLILTDERYVKRDEFATLRGKVEAIQVMQSKSSDLLENIHSTTTKIREENAIQTAKQDQIEKNIKDIKKGSLKKFLTSKDPMAYTFRFSLMALAIFIGLFAVTVVSGGAFSSFMSKNGLDISISTIVVSGLTSWKGGK